MTISRCLPCTAVARYTIRLWPDLGTCCRQLAIKTSWWGEHDKISENTFHSLRIPLADYSISVNSATILLCHYLPKEAGEKNNPSLFKGSKVAFRRSRGYRQRILWLIFLQPFSLSCPCLYFLHPFNLSQLPFPQELSFPLISPALTSWPLLSLRGHRRPCRPEKRNKLMPQAPLGGPVWLHEQRRGGLASASS